MSPQKVTFLKKPPFSNLSSYCSDSVSVTIRIIKQKTESDKPVGLTRLWGSVLWWNEHLYPKTTLALIKCPIKVWWIAKHEFLSSSLMSKDFVWGSVGGLKNPRTISATFRDVLVILPISSNLRLSWRRKSRAKVLYRLNLAWLQSFN